MEPSVEPAHHEATADTAGSATMSGGSNGPTPREADDASSSQPGHRWVVVTVALVIAMVGLVGASVAGVALASENAARARQSFERSSADVASTLQLTIREEESLIISANAFVLASPNASDAEFVKWLGTVHGFDRHPEVGGMLFIVFVQSFAQRVDRADVQCDRSRWCFRQSERHDAAVFDRSDELRHRRIGIGLGNGAIAGVAPGGRADRPTPTSGLARCVDGSAESGVDHGPHRSAAPATVAKALPARRCSSISMTSRMSTTHSVTWLAMVC